MTEKTLDLKGGLAPQSKEAADAVGASEPAPQVRSGTNLHGSVAEVRSREIVRGKRTQHVPREAPARFEPLQTCPRELRDRWERRAGVAHAQPMRAVELKCLDCCAWDRPEAPRCEIRGCPLWALNRRIFGGL